ncbi:MAG TPA: HAD-IIIA family hydrolase [Candidatus Coprenecus stercoripullorum]|nr:HAD-IIIA family hydrolase [Candidatus Coprenecus stercoripullorum]
MPNYNYKTGLAGIRAFAFDVDGVLTDGSLLSTPDGELLRVFNSKDGLAIRMCRMHGYPVAIITGGASDSILQRCAGMGIPDEDIYMASRDKLPVFDSFCRKYGLDRKEVAYCGDDIPDIPVLRSCGIAAVPADAAQEAKEASDYISSYPGGKGCVRDLVEQVLKIQGKWYIDYEKYRKL